MVSTSSVVCMLLVYSAYAIDLNTTGLMNLALKKTTKQSLTNIYGSSRAVDGSTNSYVYCAKTTRDNQPLWYVNMGVIVNIYFINITNNRNKENRPVNFTVSLGNTSESGLVDYKTCFYHEGYPSALEIAIECDRQVSTGQIHVNNSGILQLCEVEVWGTTYEEPVSHNAGGEQELATTTTSTTEYIIANRDDGKSTLLNEENAQTSQNPSATEATSEQEQHLNRTGEVVAEEKMTTTLSINHHGGIDMHIKGQEETISVTSSTETSEANRQLEASEIPSERVTEMVSKPMPRVMTQSQTSGLASTTSSVPRSTTQKGTDTVVSSLQPTSGGDATYNSSDVSTSAVDASTVLPRDESPDNETIVKIILAGVVTITKTSVCIEPNMDILKDETLTQESVKKIKSELTMETKNLSSYRRTKKSSADKRPGSTYLEGIGIAMIVLALSLVVIPGLISLVTYIMYRPRKLSITGRA